ncbi:MAG: DUF423 domain-containing protein [Synechococcaceae cyanobacterium SM2_3_2]|nr:DUF423 domain-containing protein [Synechococcaceae cyanobacterium SM2_3_2]
MVRFLVLMAGILGGTSVAAGAFASHALRGSLSERALEIFETAARYQMAHALALGLVAVLMMQGGVQTIAPLTVAGIAFLAGIAIFSGSLYALSLTDSRILGAITPLGGVAFLIGWVALGWAGWQWR